MTDEVHYLRGKDENVLVMRMIRLGEISPHHAETGESVQELKETLTESRRSLEAMERKLSFNSEAFTLIQRWCVKLGRNDGAEEFPRSDTGVTSRGLPPLTGTS